MEKTLDFSSYPPTPVIWTYNAIDTICGLLGVAGQWRSILPSRFTAPGAWLSEEYRLDSITALLPKLTTYPEFLEQTGSSHSLRSLAKFAFETPSTTLADVTTPGAMLTLLALVLILRQIKAFLLPLFSSFGRKAARHTHGPDWEKTNEIRIVKFGEYVFRLFFHSLISIAGVYFFWDKEWWAKGGTKTLFLGYPNQEIDPGMIWYYLIQCAYNLDAMISLLEMSLEIRYTPTSNSSSSGTKTTTLRNAFPISIGWSSKVRGDFREMFIHHVVTNLLVAGSSFFRFTRVGSMVFLVHDLSDVPVDLSKLANFLKWKVTTVACFASMVLVWCMTRLGLLPFVIFKSILYESWLVCQMGIVDPVYYKHYQPIFVFLIGLLILLHLAWFTMFIQMGWVLVSKGEAHDLSEHKKGEAQPDSASSKKKKKV